MTIRTQTTHIVVHCSATKASQDIGVREIREWHLGRGFSDIGYHLVIRRSGLIELGRPLQDVGAHVAGFNSSSVGVCLAGGLDDNGNGIIEDFHHYTARQRSSLYTLLLTLRNIYPIAKAVGHRDLSPDKDMDGKITRRDWLKSCPGFSVQKEFSMFDSPTGDIQ